MTNTTNDEAARTLSLNLCQAIERLPASEQQTSISIMAARLQRLIEDINSDNNEAERQERSYRGKWLEAINERNEARGLARQSFDNCERWIGEAARALTRAENAEAELARLKVALDRETYQHAACLLIAEGGGGNDWNSENLYGYPNSPAIREVQKLRADRDAARDELNLIARFVRDAGIELAEGDSIANGVSVLTSLLAQTEKERQRNFDDLAKAIGRNVAMRTIARFNLIDELMKQKEKAESERDACRIELNVLKDSLRKMFGMPS